MRKIHLIFLNLLIFVVIGTIKVNDTIAASSNTIILTGTLATKYTPSIQDDTLIDATQWTNTAISPSTGGKAVEIYGSSGGAKNTIWRGGIIKGSIPTSWDWTTTHNFGGAGITIFNDGPAEWQFVRIHNVEDAIKSREVPEYSNTASFYVHDCYFTAIRDDSIENDRFESGKVENCLFDGTYTFYSEQNENVGSSTPIGANEDNTVYLKKVFVRSYPTNKTPDSTANRFMGPWFKLQGRGVPNHKVIIEDSVFALGQSDPNMKWTNFDSPSQVTWIGNNNFILWLGASGGYQGAKPAGVIFLEGQAAQDKWITIRNKWLTDHCLPSQNFSADYNPFTAPIQQIPTSGSCSSTPFPTNQPTQPMPTIQPTITPTPMRVTPTLFCLGSCPTIPVTPTIGNPSPQPSPQPSTSQSPSNTPIPTNIQNPTATPQPPNVIPPNKGLLQFLLEFIRMLIELILQFIRSLF